jgi:chromosome partitioning protein
MHVLVLASQKGGAGKTTLAAHLAIAAEAAGIGRAVLIDTDPQGSLSAWWNVRQDESPSLASTTIAELPGKLSGLRTAGYAVAVIDTPPAITDAIRAVVATADLVLIPTRPSPHDLRAVGSTVDLIRAEENLSSSSLPKRRQTHASLFKPSPRCPLMAPWRKRSSTTASTMPVL